jgi:hypothetical protein
VNENRFSFKTDIKLTDKDQLTGTYAFQDFDAAYSNGSYTTIGPSLLNPSRSQVAGIAWTRTFTPREPRHRWRAPIKPGSAKADLGEHLSMEGALGRRSRTL